MVSALFFKPAASCSQNRAAWGDSRSQVLVLVAAVVLALGLVVAVTALALVYRETGSPQACVFEAVSASCHVGFSTGLTGRLSLQGRVIVILAMLTGRLVPLVILMRSAHIRQNVESAELESIGRRLSTGAERQSPQATEPQATARSEASATERSSPPGLPGIPLEPSRSEQKSDLRDQDQK
jgi:hypothetical protein